MRAQVFSDLWRSLVDGNTTGTDLQPSRGVPIGWLGQGTGEAVLTASTSQRVFAGTPGLLPTISIGVGKKCLLLQHLAYVMSSKPLP